MIKKILLSLLILFLIFSSVLGILAYKFAKEIPDASLIKNYRPDMSTEVYDISGKVIAHYFDRKNRIWVPLLGITGTLKDAVIAAEDDTFFEHKGFNYNEMWNAFLEDIKKWKFVRGGSTITQQLAKNVFLYKKKTIERKIKEVFLTYQIEKILTKERILELYLNEVEWGDGIYGIEAASRFYFDKPASEINLAESAILASMLPNPKYFDPYKRLSRVIKRQHRILQLMLEAKKITKEEYEDALGHKIVLREDKQEKRFNIDNLKIKNHKEKICYKHLIEKYLTERFGEDRVYRGGMRIKTGFDLNLHDNLAIIIDNKNITSARKVLVALEGEVIKSINCLIEDYNLEADEIKGKIATLGPPYNFYNYKIINEEDIPWEGLIIESLISRPSKGDN